MHDPRHKERNPFQAEPNRTSIPPSSFVLVFVLVLALMLALVLAIVIVLSSPIRLIRPIRPIEVRS